MTGNLKLKAKVATPNNFGTIQFLHASTEELKALMETSDVINWYPIYYIMWEPLLNKILAEQSAELKIELLLHLARLRGGVVDLL